MNDYQSLNHTKWECKYHVVFIPKYRRKALYGNQWIQTGAGEWLELTEATFSPTMENFVDSPDRNGIFPAARWNRFIKRHNDRGNIVFVDGHASAFKWDYVYNKNSTSREEKFNPDIIWNPNRDIP